MHRPERFPDVAIGRVAVQVTLADHLASQSVACMTIVTMRTCEIELPQPTSIQRRTGVVERSSPVVDGYMEREPARLVHDERRQREQVGRFPFERCGVHLLGATAIDPA